MGPVQLHATFATTVLLFNAVIGLWGLVRFFRGMGIDGNYWGAVALSPLVGLIQMALGLYLVSLGLSVSVRFVHYLYGALVIIAAPSCFAFLRGRDDRGAQLIFALALLLNTGFGLRAYSTGYGGVL
jgi:heme A synthase